MNRERFSAYAYSLRSGGALAVRAGIRGRVTDLPARAL